jgi:hypothetical protein
MKMKAFFLPTGSTVESAKKICYGNTSSEQKDYCRSHFLFLRQSSTAGFRSRNESLFPAALEKGCTCLNQDPFTSVRRRSADNAGQYETDRYPVKDTTVSKQKKAPARAEKSPAQEP